MATESSPYIALLKKVLIDFHETHTEDYRSINDFRENWKLKILYAIDKVLRKRQFAICKYFTYDKEKRMEGKDWPARADTMIGMKRLENIEFCFREIVKDNIPGDLIETGAWRGGATIFMRALLKDAGINNRTVWVADSFEGLPQPDEEKYNADKGDIHHRFKELAVSLETVQENFKKYGLLDEHVKFLKGWFKDTLPVAPIEKLAMIRLDGDMYESTMDGLVHLYPKLSKGGYLIIDDWGVLNSCKQAVVDYRTAHNITEEIKEIDWSGVYWRKQQ